MTTSEPYTGECKDCYQHVLSPECDGHGIRVGEPCPYGKPMEKQTINEPTTGEIVEAIRACEDRATCYGCILLDCKSFKCNSSESIADRLESQEQTIAALTARAESAERERDAVTFASIAGACTNRQKTAKK